MKQSLNLRLGQQLTMTPQLQQAIRLLQMSSIELNLEIHAALDSNPMLETEEPFEATATDPNTDAPPSADEVIPDDLPVDTAWDDVYPDANLGTGGAPESVDLAQTSSATETLQDHLLWQLNLTPMSDQDKAIGLCLIEAIADDGYLGQSLEDIQATLAPDYPIESLAEIEAVLHRIQQFDPIGVGSRNLQECMLVQLSALPEQTPWLAQTQRLVEKYLDLLAQKNYSRLKNRLGLSDEALKEMLAILTQLTPKPGHLVAAKPAEYIIPDVLVHKQAGRWVVTLNKDVSPKVRVNPSYAALVKRADSSRDNKFLQEQLQEAKWFLKTLANRNQTLLSVASCIVEKQKAFFEHGPTAMQPLTLAEVAEVLELHESTVSRITTNKYLYSGKGVFELKYFFSSQVTANNGEQCSSTAIKARLKHFIQHEDKAHPYSDQKLVALLSAEGIQVARRTVAKYREAQLIPPSSQRKSFIQS